MSSATAWCRVDLAGGTLDIWPLGLLHPSSRTISVAIDLPVTVSIEASGEGYLVEQGESRTRAATLDELSGNPETSLLGQVARALELPATRWTVSSASPRGGGLGASSALAVAAIRAAESFLGASPRPDSAVAAIARDLEARLMALPTGTQDHYAALLGGAISLSYPPGGVMVRPLEGVDLEALGHSLIVAYTGQSHFSAGNNWQVIRRRLDGEGELVECFTGIAEVAGALEPALESGDLPAVGELMAKEWSYRRRLAPEVSTDTIETLLEEAGSLGAWGGKACGAGGGGSIAILAPPHRRPEIEAALVARGGTVLATRPTARRLQVT